MKIRTVKFHIGNIVKRWA
ncbi:hypothetical protein [Serratia fonticola]|nr:hypothetical protein [Serratia fonticola]